ncbi:ribosomal protein S18 acetylase RimI-like enzyme [Desulfobaculum xiamenense]|uniref:Ribosomal protein S18 acetylase RimI-like enzyme n=1 Tax=Desulfobaculum xiamenense TaxID=995050 RepID=A0A846QGT3_9BACT|nr:GNAT family N-acetyltransferase [Desulfobaculum xiamenense]NJB68016.1 ribosomal protein S18 acetylase RimI-like enzyme [Desulfobaculum xiamenense]
MPHDLVIRSVRNDEFHDAVELCRSAVVSVYAGLFTESELRPWTEGPETERYVMRRMSGILVAVLNGSFVGMLCVDGNTIDMFHVDKVCRKRGIGSVLIAEAERRIAAAGYPHARLECFERNRTALHFYAARGFYVNDAYFDPKAEARKVEMLKPLA